MDKVCPVALRPGRHVLAFRHPLAGLQLVKGGVDPGEAPSAAATRELQEESDLSLRPVRGLGLRDDIVSGDTWHFRLLAHSVRPEAWTFDANDDGGHRFAIFWHPIGTTPPPEFTPPHQCVLDHIASVTP